MYSICKELSTEYDNTSKLIIVAINYAMRPELTENETHIPANVLQK